jgi:DNA invertase Pin-like site-specific DNA recombinase
MKVTGGWGWGHITYEAEVDPAGTFGLKSGTRLAGSTTDLLRIVDDLDRRGVGLIMLSMGGQGIDIRSPTGKLMITMLAAIAEFERGLLLERQREGVAKAKQEGKYKGRQPTARAKSRSDQARCRRLAAHRDRPAH